MNYFYLPKLDTIHQQCVHIYIFTYPRIDSKHKQCLNEMPVNPKLDLSVTGSKYKYGYDGGVNIQYRRRCY